MSKDTYTAEQLHAMRLEELFELLKEADAAITRKLALGGRMLEIGKVGTSARVGLSLPRKRSLH